MTTSQLIIVITIVLYLFSMLLIGVIFRDKVFKAFDAAYDKLIGM